jgi:hypothetical protein
MKRYALLAIALLGLLAPLPALNISAGGGIEMGGLWTRYRIKASGTKDGIHASMDAKQSENNFNFGFFGFFDATYAEFSFGYQHAVYKWKQDGSLSGGSGLWEWRGNRDSLFISLLGKYPFRLAPQFSLAPCLGVEYQIVVNDRGKGYYPKTHAHTNRTELDKANELKRVTKLNAVWINVGAQADYDMDANLYLRGSFILGFRLPTPYELHGLQMAKDNSGDSNPHLSGITVAPSLGFSVGWRLGSIG